MHEEMTMRSIYMKPSQDEELRQLAFSLRVSKSDLIRSAIASKLEEWRQAPTKDAILKDLELGKRNSSAHRNNQASEPAASPARKKVGGAVAGQTASRVTALTG